MLGEMYSKLLEGTNGFQLVELPTLKPLGTVFKILIGKFPSSSRRRRIDNQDANVTTTMTKPLRRMEMKNNKRAGCIGVNHHVSAIHEALGNSPLRGKRFVNTAQM